MNVWPYVLLTELVICGGIISTTDFKPVVEPQYQVSHTKIEWIGKIQGLQEVQNTIRTSNLPARDAFYCDSVLQAHINDINQQVYAAILAKAEGDSVKIKKK